jgi:hypothetical protein
MKPSVVRPCSGSIVGKKQSCSSVWLEHYTDNVGVSSSNLLGTTFKARVRSKRSEVKDNKTLNLRLELSSYLKGGLAQLARAPALHAGGQRFESVILHTPTVLREE